MLEKKGTIIEKITMLNIWKSKRKIVDNKEGYDRTKLYDSGSIRTKYDYDHVSKDY